MGSLEQSYPVLRTRRNFQMIHDPYKFKGNSFSTVQYIDVDNNYCYTYDYRYFFYTRYGHCSPNCFYSSVEELESCYRKDSPDHTEEDIEKLHENIYVGIQLERRWLDATHLQRKFIEFSEEDRMSPYFTFRYHDEKELFSAMRMLIAEDILRENNVDIFDIVPRIEVERDKGGNC